MKKMMLISTLLLVHAGANASIVAGPQEEPPCMPLGYSAYARGYCPPNAMCKMSERIPAGPKSEVYLKYKACAIKAGVEPVPVIYKYDLSR